ncbi:hypothetical protein [Streptomyces sp. NBC_00391]|uniref:hypothetical protein n=1 Tax=Streptomyces sp. NBC_00391 TaxID=2903647 RepID=UPI002E1C05EB
MASDHSGRREPDARRLLGAAQSAGSGSDAEAARHRSPGSPATARRPRVEVHVNELTGTMSWRTVDHPTSSGSRRQHEGAGRRVPDAAPWNARAAALRSAGLDPSRAPAQGAAPIPTHPAAVRAALGADVASLSPEQRQSHLARVGALRSGAAADLAHGTRMPTSVASRLRSTSATPAHAHALAAERTSVITRTRAPAVPQGPGPAAGPRR